MEGQESNTDVERPYPILIIPKVCTPLETNCESVEDVFLHLNILSSAEEGNETVIYSGLCNVKVMQENVVPVIFTENNQLTLPAYKDSQDQVSIDPAISPYVYNLCDSTPLETFIIQESHDNNVTIEQHNTCITQNVSNYNEDMEAVTIQYSPPVSEEQKKVKMIPETVQNSDFFNMTGEDEFECGSFLSQMSEEIINEARDDSKFVGFQTENEAMKRLMSTNIQSFPKWQKTILFSGHDSKLGQTVENIAINDPLMECHIGAGEVGNEVVIRDSSVKYQPKASEKKYSFALVSEDQKKVKMIPETVQNSDFFNMTGEDEFECGGFLSQMSEEIINEARDDSKFVGLQTENEALKQLMSTNMQTFSKWQKTILFSGHDSKLGQTVENIALNDPLMECDIEAGEVGNEVVIRDPSVKYQTKAREKKYQCNKCKQIFDQLSAFKQHTVVSHRQANIFKISGNCGKILKFQEKFEQHCLGHGNPDLECDKCHKVFASKVTLRNHRKIHSRKFPCNNCQKSYPTAQALRAHSAKDHSTFICESCQFTCETVLELTAHQEIHKTSFSSKLTETDLAEDLFEFVVSDISMSEDIVKRQEEERVQTADSEIAEVMSNTIFTANDKNNKRQSRINMSCKKCHKKFYRIGDLKRHLIEHVIRITLSKNPVNKFGFLEIRCEICQEKVFNEVDRYKAHLREHAKLTLYKCTACNKSFTDSSNLSKHKKVHGIYFQCDMCCRKFNAKERLSQHMEYHMKNPPINCRICDKVFYFESMLNKHMTVSHKTTKRKYPCRFCQTYYKKLKDKWDHEWVVHNVRKVIVDCLFCADKFRKYSELKRHCIDEHDALMPQAKRKKRLI